MSARLPSRFLVLIVFALAALLAGAPAQAQSLDQLRASGAIGERWDGYVVVRDANAAGAQATAEKVNAKRRQLYAKRASKEGATPEQVGQVYAQQILQQVPAGTWFLEQNGQWRQK